MNNTEDKPESHNALFIFAVGIKGGVCSVQADSVDLMDDGTVKFIIHNDSKSIVAAFKEYEYFFIEGIV